MLKTKKFRRLLAGLLAVLMLSVCLPVGAFAADDDPATVTIKFVDENNVPLETENQVLSLVVGELLYESETVLGVVNNVDGYIFQSFSFSAPENVPLEGDYKVESGIYTLYAHMKKLEDPAPVPEPATVTIKFVDENNASLKADVIVNPVVGEKLYESETLLNAVNSIDGYIFQNFTWSAPDNAPEEGTSTVLGGSYTLYAHYKKLSPVVTPSEDVNFRVEYVDENGQSLMAATNVATTYNDFEPSQKLADLLAKEIAEVEAEGYKQIAFTVVYEDGYETAPLNEPYVVPDYDGKTIKVYFAKVENYEDVNVRFEFVDMDGNTIQPATNYATSLSDSIVGPKVSEVLADEIDKLAADGYDFDHYAWVLADGTETVLTDPVVVPDYDGTTIKVYFVKVEEYEDVHVRFEFVDMDGNSVLPATNYATCLSDSVIGPKVNDVLADELSTMEGRNYNFHHYAWVYSDGTETELDNDVIVVPDHDGTTIKVYFEAVKTEPSDPSTGDNTTTVTGKDEHPDIAEAKANGTWGAPTATPAAASTIPQTGDSMPVVMLIVIALAAAGAVGGLVVLRKRSHQ